MTPEVAVAAPRRPLQVARTLLELATGYGLIAGVSTLVGHHFRRESLLGLEHWFEPWPCALLLVLWGTTLVLAMPMVIVFLTRPFADRALPSGLCVFVGALVATWTVPGAHIGHVVLPGIAVSLLVAIATAVEVRLRATPWHRVTVMSMFAAVCAEFLLVAGASAINALE